MNTKYYVLDQLPDLTLSKYASLDETGVEGVLSRHGTFWRQMNRRGLLEPQDAVHLFYEYNPARPQGERLCVGLRFDTAAPAEEVYLDQTLLATPLAAFYNLYPAGEPRDPRHPEKGCHKAPDINYRYPCSVHLVRKERQTKPLEPGSTEQYYTVSDWKMKEEARLYSMTKLMDAIGRPCLYVMSAYAVDMTESLEETFSYVLPKLRQLTKAKVQISATSAGMGQKDENANDTLRYYLDLLESLYANPHFICDIQVLSEDYRHAAYILDAAGAEALQEGEYALKPVPGCSFAEICGDNFRYLAMESAPESLNYLAQMFLLDEMKAFGILPALFPGESIELPKETLPDLTVKGLRLGVDTDRHQIDFPLSNLSKHAFLAGVPGSGKTNSMMHLIHEMHAGHGIPVLVLEPAKHEYRVMTTLQDMGDLELFSPSAKTRFPLHVNPFEFPKGLTLSEHIRNLLAVFDGAFHLEPPMPFLLDQSVDDVYRNHDWTHTMVNVGALTYPTMSELYERLEYRLDHSDYAPEIRSNLKSALQVRIGSLMMREMGDIFDVPWSSVPPEQWICRSAIVELESLGGDQANFMTLLIATLIRETLKVENYDKKAMDGKPRHVLFLEEAHNLIGPVAQPSSSEKADPKAAATAYIVKMLAEVRALGEGIVIADQLPTAMAPEVIKNTSLKIGLRITAQDDRQLLGGTMSANADQLEKMAVFSPGQALCSYEPLLKPFEIQIPYFEAKEGSMDDPVILQKLGASERYQQNLLRSFEIASKVFEQQWETIETSKRKFVQDSQELRKLEQESKNQSEEWKKLFKRKKNGLLNQYNDLMKDADALLQSVSAYYAPFAVVSTTKFALGHTEAAEEFRKRFRTMHANQAKRYSGNVSQLQDSMAKLGYPRKSERTERSRRINRLVFQVTPEESSYWNQVAENS